MNHLKGRGGDRREARYRAGHTATQNMNPLGSKYPTAAGEGVARLQRVLTGREQHHLRVRAPTRTCAPPETHT